MKKLSRMQKLNVAFGAAITTTVVSAAGVATTWFSIRTVGFGLGLLGSLYGLYHIGQKKKEAQE